MEIQTRIPQVREVPVLKQIWKSAFGSDEIAGFFSYYFDPLMSIVAEYNKTPVSAGHLLPAGSLVCDRSTIPCAMIYGVATLPEYRNRGFGAAVVRELISKGNTSGYPAVALCPSEDSLFEYYSARTDLSDWFFVDEIKLSGAPADNTGTGLSSVTPDDYGRLRSSFLTEIPQIEPDSRVLTYQSEMCRQYGGGLFKINAKAGDACAVVERRSAEAVCVKELLAPPGCKKDAIEAIRSAFPALEYIIRTPVPGSQYDVNEPYTTGHAIRRFGMLSAPPTIDSKLSAIDSQYPLPWFGFAFD